MKKNIVIVSFLFSLALVLFNIGCTSATSTDTTTTTGSTATTTTLPGTGAAMISGTITIPGGLAGNLWVGATTDSTLTTTMEWIEDNYLITTGDTTKSYSLPIGGATGTYYVLAVLTVGRASSFEGNPVTGDRVGEYADGKITSGWGKTPVGTPTAIVYNAGDTITGKDFDLKITW